MLPKLLTMKNTLLSILFLGILALSSCNSYHGIGTATKLSQLSANPFLQKMGNSVITNIRQEVIGKGLTSFKGKPKLLSPLNALFNTPESVSTFKGMLSNKYGLSANTVESNYGKWNTVKDVIGFVARNGKKYDFTSYSNKLL